ncbi:MAG: glutamine--fructose-6-phosphate transaminase (isomerizing) [Eubacteriales bacterium]|nr:glutamine--fructose-6-phosphate transaminase (isomerizing) [Eubacteriales bacterium]
MCGIVGYIGSEPVLPVLLDGLSRLEYRGYDSAGVAFIENGQIDVQKKKGRILNLREKLEDAGLLARQDIHIGIGHTRWATHGAPSDENSHPHLSASGRIAVVHNGIIENYLELKRFLQDQGFEFASETDTEVIAHLLEYHYEEDASQDILEAVRRTLTDLEGSYALGVLCADDPEQFIAARKDSPLVLGIGEGCNFIASDIPAILSQTRKIIIMEDREVARLTKDGIELFDVFGQPVEREPLLVTWDSEAAEKGGYEHFMMKEMHEEPRAVRDTVLPRIRDSRIRFENFQMDRADLENLDRIRIVACGTAAHAGIVGKYIIEALCRIPVEVDVASEFRYRNPIITERTLTIIISQSGETLDTLAAMREAKRLGSQILAIVNVVGSSIAREADHVIYTAAGPEIAVASTKAYNTQLAALYLLAFQMAHTLGRISDAELDGYLKKLSDLPGLLETTLAHQDDIQRFAAAHFNAHSIFFIGRGLDYALSMEASLKLKEISYIHSEAYAGGELKHGTIALIEEGTLVVCPMTQPQLVEKMISNIREVKARGAVILGILTPSCARAAEVCDQVIELPEIDPLLAPVIAVTPTQLFAYYMTVNKGFDVDKPRNLAKSVTVE